MVAGPSAKGLARVPPAQAVLDLAAAEARQAKAPVQEDRLAEAGIDLGLAVSDPVLALDPAAALPAADLAQDQEAVAQGVAAPEVVRVVQE